MPITLSRAKELLAKPKGQRRQRAAAAELRVVGEKPHAEHANRILNSIREARNKADFVIVYQHNHVFGDVPFGTMMLEELPERLGPADWLKAWTHSEIDAGADLILGHGPHVVRALELYKGRLIVYSLGNFIGYGALSSRGKTGLSLVLTPRNQPAVEVRRLELMGMRAACTCEVFLDGARAPADAVVGQEGRGWYHLLATLDEERILCAAMYVGITSAALDQV